MTIETRVKDTLIEYADSAPAAIGLLDSVRVRSQRRRRRRQGLVAGLAVVLAVGTVGAGAVLFRGVPGAVTPARTTDLVPPAYEIPPFPYTPGWEPAGIGQAYAGQYATGPYLTYPRSGPTGQPPIHVEIGPAVPTWVTGKINLSMDVQRVTVLGRPANLRTGSLMDDPRSQAVVLTWERTDGNWVVAVGSAPVDKDDLLRFADELKPEPMPVEPPFTFDLVPAGAELLSVGPSTMEFLPIEDVLAPRPGYQSGSFTVTLSLIGFAPDLDDPTTVNGHLAGLSENGISVFLDSTTVLTVTASGTLAVSREDLIRLAAGIHVTPAASIKD
jgi:hypothetical protein